MGKSKLEKESIILKFEVRLIDGKTINATLNHHCASTKDALKLMEEFIKRKRRKKPDA